MPSDNDADETYMIESMSSRNELVQSLVRDHTQQLK